MQAQRSIASSYDVLEKKGQKWHLAKYLGIAGNYLLMMFYTTISGWMLIYFIKYADGSILAYKSAEELGAVFGTMISNPRAHGLRHIRSHSCLLQHLLVRSAKGRREDNKMDDGGSPASHGGARNLFLHALKRRRGTEILSRPLAQVL